MLLRSTLDPLEQRLFLLFTIDNEGTVEDFVAAVLRVYLREAEHLRVGKLATDLTAYVVKVFYLLLAKRKTFALVVLIDILDVHNWFGLLVNGKDFLSRIGVKALQHVVVLSIGAGNFKKFFDTKNAANSHVLSNFDGIRTPRSDHLAARPNVETAQRALFYCRGITK